jgi:hypothetical protein
MLIASPKIETIKFDILQGIDHSDPRQTHWYISGDRKYGDPFWYAEKEKLELRSAYKAAVDATKGEPREVFLSRSRAFWEEYEDVNRHYIPNDPVYSGSRVGITLSTSADLCTLTVGASGQHRQLEIYLAGESTTSTVLRFAVNRPSTGGTTATNQTPEKFNTRSPANVSTFATTWTTQPTLSTNHLILFAFNTFGGTERFVPAHGAEIYQVNSEQVSFRSLSGTPVVSGHVIWEEL